MGSEEIQQENLLLTGVGGSESAPSSAVAVSSAGEDLTAPLNEDLALALLERRDLPPETLEQLGHDLAALKSRKVCVALAAHPHAPRHLALRLLRHFYTGDHAVCIAPVGGGRFETFCRRAAHDPASLGDAGGTHDAGSPCLAEGCRGVAARQGTQRRARGAGECATD